MLDVIPPQVLLIASTVMAIAMGTFVMVMRMRSQKKPATARKIIIPPIAMSTGALMFLFEPFRVAPLQILEAVGIGLLFSTVLIATSKFEIRGTEIYMKASKAFPFILLGLLIGRIILKLVFANTLDVGELGGMFWIVAFAMILPWRIAMLLRFNKQKSLMQLK